MIEVKIPGCAALNIGNLVMDFNGTLAVDGYLINGVSKRLEKLSSILDLFVLTADTFGLVEESCAGLPVRIQKLQIGDEAEQKRAAIKGIGYNLTAAIGNGANDYKMLEEACLSIIVLGGEGTCAKALAVADICVPDICTGLDLFLYPKRIMATLRK